MKLPQIESHIDFSSFNWFGGMLALIITIMIPFVIKECSSDSGLKQPPTQQQQDSERSPTAHR